jgi:hypothetical protein
MGSLFQEQVQDLLSNNVHFLESKDGSLRVKQAVFFFGK